MGICICFLPEDSLLFSVGLLVSQGVFKVWVLLPAMIIAAIVGYFIVYWFVEKMGDWLLGWEDSFWFKKTYLLQEKKFYDKHERESLILG